MTEKRFIMNEVGCIVDLRDNSLKNYEGQETVDLMNELAEENERIKTIIETGIIDFELNMIEDPFEVYYRCGVVILQELYIELYGGEEYGEFLANQSLLRDKRKKERDEND